MAIRSYFALGMLLPPIIIMAHGYSHALNTIYACWVYHVESVSKMFDYLFAIYGVACVELAHSSLVDWKDISIIHLIFIIKSEVSTFPIVVIFFRGYVSEMVVLPYSVIVLLHIYLENTGTVFQLFVFSLFDVQSMVFANDRIHYGLQVVFVCLQITPYHYHHCADSSEGIELIKCLSGICCRVCV